jgi:hypothetical protein
MRHRDYDASLFYAMPHKRSRFGCEFCHCRCVRFIRSVGSIQCEECGHGDVWHAIKPPMSRRISFVIDMPSTEVDAICTRMSRTRAPISVAGPVLIPFAIPVAIPVPHQHRFLHEIEALRARLTCSMCLDADCNCRLSCGHCAFCSECAKQLQLCPLCRQPVVQMQTCFPL